MDILDIILEKFSKGMMKRNKGVAVVPNTSTLSKSNIVKAVHKTKNSYYKNLKMNMDGFIGGSITMDEYLFLQRSTITDHFKDSYLLGKLYSQIGEDTLSEDEVRSIGYQVSKEMEFMKKFAEDISNSTGRMNYSRRLEMYADGVFPMFLFGKLVYMPEDVKITWNLGNVDKHCVDCLAFAANNPYKKKTIPTVPRAGGSRCLSNCQCYLTYDMPNAPDGEYESFVLNKYSPVGNTIPDEGQYSSLKSLSIQFYYNRAMSEIDKKYIDATKASKNAYLQYIEDNELAVMKGLPVQEYLQEFRAFMNCEAFTMVGMSDLNVGDFVSFFRNGKQTYGKVGEMTQLGAFVINLSGERILINDRYFIIFKEKKG